jgi:signal transduction histidine kinase
MRNAIEHTSQNVTVTVGEVKNGFYIEDDGSGIPEDSRDDVFDAGHTTTDEGTGFGLSIVKGVAEAHGWEISITEGSEGGARFEITNVEFETS